MFGTIERPNMDAIGRSYDASLEPVEYEETASIYYHDRVRKEKSIELWEDK